MSLVSRNNGASHIFFDLILSRRARTLVQIPVDTKSFSSAYRPVLRSLWRVVSRLCGWSVVAGAVAVRLRHSHVLTRTDADRHWELGRHVVALGGRMRHGVLRVNDHSRAGTAHQCRVRVLHARHEAIIAVLIVVGHRLAAVRFHLVTTGATCHSVQTMNNSPRQSETRRAHTRL